MLRTNRKCDPTVEFSKYEFKNKLLVGVIFFKVTPGVIWTQSIHIYMGWVQVTSDVTLSNINITPLNNLL